MKVRSASYLFLILFAASLLRGQGTTSRVLGVVQDPTGAAVPGAAVRLTSETTGVSFTTTTTAAGTYVFEAVQPGRYGLTVEAAGFKRFVSRDNIVAIGQPTTLNVTLELGQVTESIEVAAAAELVQTSTSGNFGNLLPYEVIRDLPIVGTRGRNPLELVLRQPGVVSGAHTGGGVHVRGARDRAWNYTLDGIDVNETSAGGANFAPLRTNPDSLAEFRVLTGNFTAEFGRNSGGQVTMITRSGGNEVHGTGFFFYRTPRLNANEWEFNLNQIPKRQFVQHIWGGSLGGPVVRNRMFYFANAQRLTARESAQVDRIVYTSEMRRGIYRYNRAGRNLPFGSAGTIIDSQGNLLPGASVGTYNIFASDPERIGPDPRIRSLIDKTPLPNNFSLGDGLNTAGYTFAALQWERQLDTVAKLDYVVNDRNAVYGRIAWGFQDTNCDRVNGGQPFFPGGGCVVNTERDPHNLAFNWRTNPTPRITNELVFGRNYFQFNFNIPTADLSKIMLTSAPVTVPETYYFGNRRAITTWQLVDNFAYFQGGHALKFGFNLRLQKHLDTRGSIGGFNATQDVDFSRLVNTVDARRFGLPDDVNQQFDRPLLESHINFLLGRVGTTRRGFPSRGDQFVTGLYNFDARYHEYDFYIQDTWKLRRNLMVDVGLRWEVKRAPRSNPAGRIRRPNQAVAAGAAPSATLRWIEGPLYDDDWNNLGPSVGFAWDPLGRGRTSVRSNYRIAYDRINTFVLSSSIFQNLPGQVQGLADNTYGQGGGRLANLPVLNPPAVKPSELAQPPPFSAGTVTVVDPNFRSPITHQWALGIQQQMAARTVVEFNYIGRRAYGLFGAYNLNQAEIFRNGFVEAFRTVKAGGASPLIDQLLGVDPRRLAAETGSAAMRRIYAVELANNAVATVARDISRRTVRGVSQAEAAGLGPFLLLPFPQYAGGMNVIDSNDFSTYHAFEAQIERRYHNGVAWQLSYTFSKSLDTRSYDPAFIVVSTGAAQSASSTPFDAFNRRLNYALSDFDRTHVVQSYYVYELPFGRGKRWALAASPLLERLLGGWQIAGFTTIQSGRPFTVYSGFDTFSSVVNSTADCRGCARGDGRVFDDARTGFKFYFAETERARFTTPAAGELGNTGRNFFRGPGAFNMDASLLKRTRLNERFTLELRADMTNLTNTPTFGFPTAIASSATFGRIRDAVISGSRKIQLGAKLHF